MAKFTLLEVHLDGAEFTANAPGSDALPDDLTAGEPGEEAAEDSGAGLGLAAVLALVVLVAAAVAAKKLLGEPTDDAPLDDR